MNYMIEGEGQAIVFVHGLSDNLLYWEPLSSVLKENFTVIRYDLRGHGETELGSDEISIELLVEDLHDLLCELDIEKANIVGFSLGGMVGLEFILKYPSFASSIVLISTFAKVSQYTEDMLNQILNALDGGFEEFFDFMIPRVLCPGVIDASREELEVLKSIASQNADVEAFKKAVQAMFSFDVWDRLDEIDIPALVLAGNYDEISLLSEQREFSDVLPNAELIVLDNVKHNLLVGERIGEVIDILNGFLAL